MTDTPEIATDGVPSASVHRDTRPYRVLAWVGIVAGIVFIVGAVFVSGLFAGRATGGYGWHRGYQGGQMGGCPMMQMMQPGGMGPGGMPGMGGPKGTGPSSMMPMPPMPMPSTTAGR